MKLLGILFSIVVVISYLLAIIIENRIKNKQ
jgi:hypothetical protein